MSWRERLNRLEERARETAGFNYNAKLSRMYSQLSNAVNRRDAETTKSLIVKMGF